MFRTAIEPISVLCLVTWGTSAVIGALIVLAMIYPFMVLRKYVRIMINIVDDLAPQPDRDGRDFDLLQGEDFTFRAGDGHKLEGTILRGEGDDSRGMVIFAHEFGSDRTSCVRYCSPLLDAGYDVFAFDFRGHGQSRPEARYRPRQWPSDRERADMLGAIAFVGSWLEQQGRPRDLALFGLSRGAGIAILAAEGIEDVKAIITDGVYSSDTTMEYMMKRFATIFAKIRVIAENHPPSFWKLLRWLLFREYACRFRCRFPSVRKVITRLGDTPILMIHGEKDSYLPSAQTQALFESIQGPKELWIVPGAKHNQAVFVQPEEYARRIVRFMDRHVATQRSAPVLEPAYATYDRREVQVAGV